MRYNIQNHWVWVRACLTNDVFWSVTSQHFDVLRVSQCMLARSLAAPHQDLLRPRAQWRPQLWARWWTLCCPYREGWCCCHCRRILSGKAGREICAKTRRQATLHGWTDNTVDSCINRHQQEDKHTKEYTEIPDSRTNRSKPPSWHVFKLYIRSCFQNWHWCCQNKQNKISWYKCQNQRYIIVTVVDLSEPFMLRLTSALKQAVLALKGLDVSFS